MVSLAFNNLFKGIINKKEALASIQILMCRAFCNNCFRLIAVMLDNYWYWLKISYYVDLMPQYNWNIIIKHQHPNINLIKFSILNRKTNLCMHCFLELWFFDSVNVSYLFFKTILSENLVKLSYQLWILFFLRFNMTFIHIHDFHLLWHMKSSFESNSS